jgi:hypothetical protein
MTARAFGQLTFVHLALCCPAKRCGWLLEAARPVRPRDPLPRATDLLVNPDTRVCLPAAAAVREISPPYLDANAFEEVETPVLQTKASGALAKPFFSHHNALDIDVTLRIAPETWLKRLLVGGYERVYEFARCFRNEGMDPSHLQDFTMCEWYAAYLGLPRQHGLHAGADPAPDRPRGGSRRIRWGTNDRLHAAPPRVSLRDQC